MKTASEIFQELVLCAGSPKAPATDFYINDLVPQLLASGARGLSEAPHLSDAYNQAIIDVVQELADLPTHFAPISNPANLRAIRLIQPGGEIMRKPRIFLQAELHRGGLFVEWFPARTVSTHAAGSGWSHASTGLVGTDFKVVDGVRTDAPKRPLTLCKLPPSILGTLRARTSSPELVLAKTYRRAVALLLSTALNQARLVADVFVLRWVEWVEHNAVDDELRECSFRDRLKGLVSADPASRKAGLRDELEAALTNYICEPGHLYAEWPGGSFQSIDVLRCSH